MTRLFLVDNSVVQRLRNPLVQQAWRDLADDGEIATCLPTMLEAGYSARSAVEYETWLALERRSAVFLGPTDVVAQTSLEMQRALFAAGKGRAVGVSDLQIAATAVAHSGGRNTVTVAHYDADFDHVASVFPSLRTQWVVPRGTVD